MLMKRCTELGYEYAKAQGLVRPVNGSDEPGVQKTLVGGAYYTGRIFSLPAWVLIDRENIAEGWVKTFEVEQIGTPTIQKASRKKAGYPGVPDTSGVTKADLLALVSAMADDEIPELAAHANNSTFIKATGVAKKDLAAKEGDDAQRRFAEAAGKNPALWADYGAAMAKGKVEALAHVKAWAKANLA